MLQCYPLSTRPHSSSSFHCALLQRWSTNSERTHTLAPVTTHPNEIPASSSDESPSPTHSFLPQQLTTHTRQLFTQLYPDFPLPHPYFPSLTSSDASQVRPLSYRRTVLASTSFPKLWLTKICFGRSGSKTSSPLSLFVFLSLVLNTTRDEATERKGAGLCVCVCLEERGVYSRSGFEKSIMPLRFAMVCASNMNRSMEAHRLALEAELNVRSFGVGQHVKLPGASQNSPNVYNFGTTYKYILDDLRYCTHVVRTSFEVSHVCVYIRTKRA